MFTTDCGSAAANNRNTGIASSVELARLNPSHDEERPKYLVSLRQSFCCYKKFIERRQDQVRILVVEDEVQLGRAIQTRLQEADFIVDLVDCAANAEAAAATAPYAVIILDRRLPDGDGLRSIKALRRTLPGVRIIMLTALDTITEKILGLEAGADDYLTKPFEPDELVARVRAALRRPGATAQPPIICGNLCYDPNHREFAINGENFLLKRREHVILESLMTRARRVVQREFFMETAYGFDDEVQSNTLDAHISRLRAKLLDLGASVQIRSVRGVGYMISEL